MIPRTVKVKLVTIVCGYEHESGVVELLREFGPTGGYTVTSASGKGLHGQRKRGVLDGGNLRIEVLVPLSVADALIDAIATRFTGDPLTAFVHEVDAFPSEHFAV